MMRGCSLATWYHTWIKNTVFFPCKPARRTFCWQGRELTSIQVPLFSPMLLRCMMLRISSLTAWALPPRPHVASMLRTHSWASPPVFPCTCLQRNVCLPCKV